MFVVFEIYNILGGIGGGSTFLVNAYSQIHTPQYDIMKDI